MRTVKYCLLAGLTLGLVGMGLLQSREDDKPKFTIKEVMQKAHKDGLLKKVAGGKASKEEKEQLVELYTALAGNKPPKGDAADWKTKTEAMVKAAKVALKDDDKAKDALKVVNCKACHDNHK